MPVRSVAAVCALLSIALLALIVWASLEKNVLTIFVSMWAERWGIVTLVDLYAGFIVTGLLIFAVERRPRRVLPWLIGIFFLGNLATLVWVLVRALRSPSIAAIFTPGQPAPLPAAAPSVR